MLDIDPQAILIFVMVIAAGLKALFERLSRKNKAPLDEDFEPEFYEPGPQPDTPSAKQSSAYDRALEKAREFFDLPLVEPEVIEAGPPPIPMTPPPPPPREVVDLALETKKPPPPKPVSRKPNFISTRERLRRHLASPTAAREALLLSEIFGKPKGLQ